jgi:hypothetical protein
MSRSVRVDRSNGHRVRMSVTGRSNWSMYLSTAATTARRATASPGILASVIFISESTSSNCNGRKVTALRRDRRVPALSEVVPATTVQDGCSWSQSTWFTPGSRSRITSRCVSTAQASSRLIQLAGLCRLPIDSGDATNKNTLLCRMAS